MLAEHDPERAGKICTRLFERLKYASTISGNSFDLRNILYQVFNQRDSSDNQLRFVLSVIAELDDPEADKWFGESFAYNYFNARQQDYVRDGLGNHESYRAAAQDAIALVMSQNDETSLACYLRWFDRVNRDQYEVLAEWIREQSFGTSERAELLCSMLVPDGGEERLLDYLLDEDRSAAERARLYAWLQQRHSNRIETLNQPEFSIRMIEVVENADNVRFPRNTYLDLLNHVEQLPEDDTRDALAEQLLQLWRNEKVDGAPTSSDVLVRLVEFSSRLGRDADAKAFLGSSSLSVRPESYALALRLGYEEYVRRQLPRMVTQLQNQYHSTVWIPEELVPLCDSILEDIDDEQLRALVRTVFARFYVRDAEDQSVKDLGLPDALAEADRIVDQPKLMRWMIEQFNSGDTGGQIAGICARYVEHVDMLDVLRRNNANETRLFTDHLKQYAEEHDAEAIRPFVETVWNRLGKNTARDISNREIFPPLFDGSLSPDDSDAVSWVAGFIDSDEWPVGFQQWALVWLLNQRYEPVLLKSAEGMVRLLDRQEKESRQQNAATALSGNHGFRHCHGGGAGARGAG